MALHSDQEKQQQFLEQAGCQGPLSKSLSNNENHRNTLRNYAKIHNPPMSKAHGIKIAFLFIITNTKISFRRYECIGEYFFCP